MKIIITFYAIFFSIATFSQSSSDFNLKDGFIANGYDVIAYFDRQAIKGDDKFITEYKGINFKFSNRKNLDLFITNPEKYIPRYGGFCAWAIAHKGEKVNIDPESFEVRDGKLYLFYESFLADTRKKWQKNKPNDLVLKADQNWTKMVKKKVN